ncbi:MAG: tetratricopeptide repeat protein [Pseudonocardiaceae bacterium]|nr:tetratricopeptide repeat protein [Pseudonocardiaceae bacterium]
MHGDVHFHAIPEGVIPRQPAPAFELTVPQQLSPAPPHFTNRTRELAELNRIVGESRILVISGLGGIGKTALAHTWLNQLCDRYPDGQLQVNLGGLDPAYQVPTTEVLGRFLRGLGVLPAMVPADVDEQGAMYRSLTKDKALLVLLDNAASADQILPLLPNSASSLVVTTSRLRLATLRAADRLFLERFEPKDGLELLSTALGPERVDSETSVARDLVERCDGFPLALSIIGASLALRRHSSIARVVTDLDDERRRLNVLSSREDASMQAVLDVSYEALSAEAARFYRLLGLHPTSEFGGGVAAATVDRSVREVDALIEQLLEASLLEEIDRDRYQFHDLVRLHARERAERHDPEPEREAALRRIFEWYLHTAMATGDLTTPDQDPIRYVFDYLPADPVTFASRDEALGWLEKERANLITVIRTVAEQRMPVLGWQLANAMWPLFLLHKHYRDFLAVSEIGVRCAQEWGNRWAEALMHNRCGAACRGAGRFDDAVEHYSRALRVLPETGDQAPAIRSLEGFGLVALARGQLDDALRHFDDNLRRSRELDRQHDVSLVLVNIGATLTKVGRFDEAIENLEHARESLAAQGDDYNVARARTDLGNALGRAGQFARAREHLDGALAAMRAAGSSFEEARVLMTLGEVAEQAGDAEEARHYYETALPIFVELGRPEAKRIDEKLSQQPDS